MKTKKVLTVISAAVLAAISVAVLLYVNVETNPKEHESLIYIPEEEYTSKAVILDEASVSLTEILNNKCILYIGNVNEGTICCVTADFDEYGGYVNKRAVFFDTNNNTLLGTSVLSDNAEHYNAASGHFFAAEKALMENAMLYAYSFDGTLQNSFVYNESFSADKYFEEYMETYYPDFEADTAELSDEKKKKEIAQIKENAFSGSELFNMFFCWGSDGESLFYNEIYGKENNCFKVNLKNGTNEEFIYDDTKLRHFVGCSENHYLTYYTEDGSTVVELCSLDGNVQKKWSYGSYKRCTANGNYAVIYNYNDNQEITPTVTVLNLQAGKDTDIAVKTKQESYWAKVSGDGKVLLTFDKIGTFRLYDVKTANLLSEFEVAYTVNVTENTICIDTENSSVYIAVQNENKFGIAVINY